MGLLRTLILSLVVAIAIAADGLRLFETKNHENCDLWASEGECINNPNYMWSHCHSSCMQIARDDDERCQPWAEEGECTANPNYIQFHCPESCSRAVAWSIWMRRNTGIDDVLPYSENFDLRENYFNLIDVLRYVSDNLALYTQGGARMSKFLSSTAPTEYLGMMGLSEAVLYGLRIAQIIATKLDLSSNLDAQEKLLIVHENIKALHDDVTHVLSSGYHSDWLSRMVPRWSNDLEYFASTLEDLVPHGAMEDAKDDSGALSNTRVLEHYSSVDCYSWESCESSRRESYLALIPPAYVLRNAVEIPSLGLGTWQLEGQQCYDVVREAVRLGYRHFDTAEAYRNEAVVGQALRDAMSQGEVDRSQLFIANKLSDSDAHGGYQSTLSLVKAQLAAMELDFFDLYMLHSPFADRFQQRESWRALEDLLAQGVIRALGVSNFNSEELENLLEDAAVHPMVIQNKVDVYHVGKQLDNKGDDIVALARKHGILVIGYSGFSSYPFSMVPTRDPLVKSVADRVGLTAAQVLLQWSLQHGMAVIPRASNAQHLRENLYALTSPPLPPGAMAMLDSLQYLVESPVSHAVGLPLDQ